MHQRALLEQLSSDLAAREAALAQLSSTYSANAPAVVSARDAVDKLRGSLEDAEHLEVRKLSMEQLRLRRYQAANEESIQGHALCHRRLRRPRTRIAARREPGARAVGQRPAHLH